MLKSSQERLKKKGMQTVALVSKQGLKIGFVFVKRFCIFPLEGSSAGLPEQQKVLNGCVVDIR